MDISNVLLDDMADRIIGIVDDMITDPDNYGLEYKYTKGLEESTEEVAVLVAQKVIERKGKMNS